MATRTRSNRQDAAETCCDSMNCACVRCTWLYVVRGLELRDAAISATQQQKFVTNAAQQQWFLQQFMQRHGICRQQHQKRSQWLLKDDPQYKVGSLEMLVFGWFNTNDSIRDLSLECDAKTSHGPFPTRSIAVQLFSSAINRFRLTSVDQELQRFGARPVPTVLAQGVRVHWIAKYGDTRATEARFEDTVTQEVRKRMRSEVATHRSHVFEQWEFKDRVKEPEAMEHGFLRPKAAILLDNDMSKETPVEGTVRQGLLTLAFKSARMNGSSVFVDVGCWYGGPMVLAKKAFGVRIAFGLEVMAARTIRALTFLLSKSVPAFPIHIAAECISFFDPATHVFIFMQGMDPVVRRAIKTSIEASTSVVYVITDRAKFLDGSFDRVAQHSGKMAGASTCGGVTLYIYRRKTEGRRKITKTAHPVFLPGIFLSRLPPSDQLGFLKSQLERMSRNGYRPVFFAGAQMKPTKRPLMEELVCIGNESPSKRTKSLGDELTSQPSVSLEVASRLIDELDWTDYETAKRRATNASSELIYGEVHHTSFFKLLRPLVIEGDIFCDVGCGFGQLVILAALCTPVKTSFGIEILEQRIRVLKEAIAAKPHKLIKKCVALLGDFRSAEGSEIVANSTIVFMNNIRFEEASQEHILRSVIGGSTRILITTEKICPRHREHCRAVFCATFAMPAAHKTLHTSHGRVIGFVYIRKDN